MKPEIDTEAKVMAWLKRPESAVFQGQNLITHSSEIAAKPLEGCVFLGCRMEPSLAEAAAKAGCFIIPRRDDVAFDAFTPGVYSPDELFDKLKDGGEYKDCLDYRIYRSFVDPTSKDEIPVDLDIVLLRRLHDASISNALDDLLDPAAKKMSVAIMGGHDKPRDAPIYAAVAKLALDLATTGYTVITGGGPGLMEAGNLGAYCAGFPDPEETMKSVIAKIKDAATYDHADWLKLAYAAWQDMGRPANEVKSRNIGIPTWFYGHEPPNVFATHIAKYFENSVREEGLLAIGQGGIIFAEGNGGTVQEIFQDANQNYYRTIAKVKSPMVLFGVDYWNPDTMDLTDLKNKKKKVYPILEKLATEKGFADYVFITDDTGEVLRFIKEHPPVA